MNTALCPDKESLFGYVVGTIPEDEAEEVAAHLTSCPACQQTVEALEGLSDTMISASDPEILQTQWPFALRAAEFDALRDEFHLSREAILQDLRVQGQVGSKNGEKLISSLDELLVELEKAYPDEKRRQPATFLRYNAAKRYLRSIAAESHHAIQEGDRSIADGATRFRGGTILDLILHMDRTGLAFAPPAPGGDRVYRSLLSAMRSLYLTWGK